MTRRRGKQRPTMSDVAQLAGVSKMTVSRVINGYANVTSETAEKVQHAIQSLGYVRSQRGRSLAVGRTNLLGIIVLDITSEWVWPLVRGAGREAEAQGYQLLLQTTGAGEVATFGYTDPLLSDDYVDGLIIVSWRVPLWSVERLARRGFPVVVVDAFARLDDVSWVSAQDRQGARLATSHLIELGHRRIGCIGGGDEPYLAKERLAGFREALDAAGLDRDLCPVVQGDFSQRSGYEAAAALLAASPRPTAIFAANDLMAMGAMHAMQEAGVRFPDDMSIVGFDDIASASRLRPGLTTVARPYAEMGAMAVRQATRLMRGPDERGTPMQSDLPVELIVRESSAPLAQGPE
jgi:DNA-binding LacI/PurR family transcriptional regulator